MSGVSLPAPSLIQTLGSDSLKDEEAEARNRVWKQVQNERKKYVSFSCPKSYGKDNLVAALKASGKVYAFSGQLNVSHRLFYGSAELLEEEGIEPWMNSTEPKKDRLKGICDMGSITGTTDFCLRMRSIRRISVPGLTIPIIFCFTSLTPYCPIVLFPSWQFVGFISRQEDSLLQLAQTEEVPVIYSGGCPARAGRMKARVSCSSLSRGPYAFEDLQKANFQFLWGSNQLSANLQRRGLPQCKGASPDQLGRAEKGLCFCGPGTRRAQRKPP